MSAVPIDINLVLTVVWFCGNAVIGAIAYIYFNSVTERDKRIRHIILAGIAGYIYFYLYSEHNYPNSFMAIVVGWFAPDLIEGIMKKYKEKKGGNGE